VHARNYHQIPHSASSNIPQHSPRIDAAGGKNGESRSGFIARNALEVVWGGKIYATQESPPQHALHISRRFQSWARFNNKCIASARNASWFSSTFGSCGCFHVVSGRLICIKFFASFFSVSRP
jgi:hypothetical protein